jgi:hypothetical protein
VGGLISASTEYRLNNNSYSRVAILDGGGAIAGGYNFNINGGTAQHDSTGALSAYYYNSAGYISFYTNSSQSAGTAAQERLRITSGGNLLVGSTSDNGNKLQVYGNTYTEGIYNATGSFSQGASTTSTFYTFNNSATNRVFLITLRQQGASANTVIAIGFTYSGVLAAYNIAQENTNPALYLTITSTGGLGLQLTTGSGYGTTTWEWTITQIK